MDHNLRSKVIRLAHQQPALRPHLLPLLKEAAAGLPRDFYLPRNNPTLMKRKGTPPNLEIWTYEQVDGSGKTGYYGVAFSGKASKPIWNYRFRDVLQQEKQIADSIETHKSILDRKLKTQQGRQQFQHGLQVGDILYGSWGYEQTNAEFYEVVGLPSAKQVEIRELAKKSVREEQGADYVVPVPRKYIGPVLRKIPGVGGIKIESYLTVSKWDGKPKYETASGWGH